MVKCLVFYHPDDPQPLRAEQEAALLRLAEAARGTRREWLQEVIIPRGMERAPDTLARALQRFYDLGMRPDWWKLEPDDRAESWANIARVIEANDPLCRGVVLLGLSAPEAQLIASFDAAAACPMVKGFAVGRTIFAAAAEAWLAGKMSDDAAVDDLARVLARWYDSWRAAKAGAAHAGRWCDEQAGSPDGGAGRGALARCAGR